MPQKNRQKIKIDFKTSSALIKVLYYKTVFHEINRNIGTYFFCIYLAGYPVGTVGKGESWLELLDVYLAPARPPRPPGFSKSSSSFTIAA